jgi:hypothetical protein
MQAPRDPVPSWDNSRFQMVVLELVLESRQFRVSSGISPVRSVPKEIDDFARGTQQEYNR